MDGEEAERAIDSGRGTRRCPQARRRSRGRAASARSVESRNDRRDVLRRRVVRHPAPAELAVAYELIGESQGGKSGTRHDACVATSRTIVARGRRGPRSTPRLPARRRQIRRAACSDRAWYTAFLPPATPADDAPLSPAAGERTKGGDERRSSPAGTIGTDEAPSGGRLGEGQLVVRCLVCRRGRTAVEGTEAKALDQELGIPVLERHERVSEHAVGTERRHQVGIVERQPCQPVTRRGRRRMKTRSGRGRGSNGSEQIGRRRARGDDRRAHGDAPPRARCLPGDDG